MGEQRRRTQEALNGGKDVKSIRKKRKADKISESKGRKGSGREQEKQKQKR